MLVFVQFVALGTLIWLARLAEASTSQYVFALVIAIAGALVLARAAMDLRRALTVFPEPRADAPFVTNGIYSAIRHPMYLAVLIVGVALCIIASRPLAWSVLALLALDLRVKYRYEDALLADRWPSAREYQRRVGALLPRIR